MQTPSMLVLAPVMSYLGMTGKRKEMLGFRQAAKKSGAA
jgi:hypothetical protein